MDCSDTPSHFVAPPLDVSDIGVNRNQLAVLRDKEVCVDFMRFPWLDFAGPLP
jgi:hypothetical protein